MFALLLQLSITCIWGATIGVHTRRLLRLAHFEFGGGQGGELLRHRLDRVWWWLGRAEFWSDLQHDCLRSLQLTLLIFLLAAAL